jgi:1-acyl-sn-glycerol-3-phosphate acyltransferase
MIGWIRIVLGLSLAAIVTPPLLLWQMLAMATGMNEALAPRLWHKMVMFVLGFRVHVHGRLADQRPLLVAANHISWTDIMLLGSVADVYFISKSELAGWPIIGYLARYQRTVFVERERRRKSGEQAAEIAIRLVQGHPMVLFAEGSTHDGNHMAPFKSTLFGAASLALSKGGVDCVHVQPVAIAYTRLQGLPMGRQHRVHAAWIGDRTLVPHIKALLREGAVDVEVHFGEPVAFTAESRRKEVAAAVEAQVRTMMRKALAEPKRGK